MFCLLYANSTSITAIKKMTESLSHTFCDRPVTSELQAYGPWWLAPCERKQFLLLLVLQNHLPWPWRDSLEGQSLFDKSSLEETIQEMMVHEPMGHLLVLSASGALSPVASALKVSS